MQTKRCSCSGMGDCRSEVHAHKPPTNVGDNAHPAGYGWCSDGPPPASANARRCKVGYNYIGGRCVPMAKVSRCGPGYNFIMGRCVPEASVSGLGDAMGPDTARAYARYAMAASKLAPGLYNPASAMDQVLESINPGLSKTVTTKAGAMMMKGVQPQVALEEALTESFVALAPKYPKYPKAPAMSGLGTTTTTTVTRTGAAARLSAGADLASSIGTAVAGLLEGVTGLVVGVQTQRRERDQQNFEQRMAEANAARQEAEAAALREAGALGPVATGGGLGAGTILLGVLGLAAAGGAIYLITKKK